MRLGLIGDVHAEDALLRLTLDTLRREGVDQVLCTGDLVDGLGDIEHTCALLRDHHVQVVRGNHDQSIRADEMRSLPHAHRMTDLSVEAITFLKGLPPIHFVDLPQGGRVLLCHGVGPNDMQRLGPDDGGYAISSNDDLLAVLFDPTIAFMVGGHTHRPMVRRFERGAGKVPLVVVNPGTLARDDEPGFALLDATARRVEQFRITSDRLAPVCTRMSTATV